MPRKKCLKCGRETKKASGVCAKCVGKNTVSASGILTEADLRGRYDYALKLRQVAASIQDGQFFLEAAVREMAGIPPANFRSYADSGEFDKYKGRNRDKMYWGHPDAIERMKSENILQ